LKFLLFDIDGTLIDSGGAGSRALNLALEDLLGISNGFFGIELAGKTDLQIIREGLERLGMNRQDGIEHDLIQLYVGHLKREVSRGAGHLKSGVNELLMRLDAEGIYLGLLTGNIEDGARVKLAPFGLNRFFPIGAYGSDDEDRNRLVPVAVRRLMEKKGVLASYEDCIIVGDTPRDVACARVHGSRCIAVATGPYSLDLLRGTEADLAVSDLSDADRIINWISDA
jgi:phosphoglycolate phosphatase